jgi:hypothetical protein
MIKLYGDIGTSNLGDFLNSLPVLSGMSKTFNHKIQLILQSDMIKFNGIRELIEYQDFIDWVKFDHEVPIEEKRDFIPFNSWVDPIYDGIAPMETTRYQKKFGLYGINFDIDNDYILKIQDIDIDCSGLFYVGDRCLLSTNDKSRPSGILYDSGKFNDCYFIDYSKSCMHNANIIKKCGKFISTFTGIAVMADLLNVDFDLYYDSDFDGWAEQPIEYSYKKHFYMNRKSNLKLL